LNNALYGFKKASYAFWNSTHPNLTEKSFDSILDDPCLFRRVALGGSVILVRTYFGDFTYADSSQGALDSLLSELRERFVTDKLRLRKTN
jgi:hypothetical protein